ncbi:hypothetical protein N6H13_20665 [Paenibacillus sp. CC-CFT742]|nr:hypothetical protein [Paenibacillus sp. CC-CFT742]WJH27618.1 hypothetical protein N6H13_20665 [Paenibacillus sp. CC-CFT742]
MLHKKAHQYWLAKELIYPQTFGNPGWTLMKNHLKQLKETILTIETHLST